MSGEQLINGEPFYWSPRLVLHKNQFSLYERTMMNGDTFSVKEIGGIEARTEIVQIYQSQPKTNCHVASNKRPGCVPVEVQEIDGHQPIQELTGADFNMKLLCMRWLRYDSFILFQVHRARLMDAFC